MRIPWPFRRRWDLISSIDLHESASGGILSNAPEPNVFASGNGGGQSSHGRNFSGNAIPSLNIGHPDQYIELDRRNLYRYPETPVV